jgi:glycine hydroxymethyltransferase
VSTRSFFGTCQNVRSCRHKTLRGPRAGLVFFRKDGEAHKDLEKRVNDAVFPACQGGPHNNTIAGIATTLLQAAQPSWKTYAQQVIKNAQALADELLKHGYKLQTGGTDSHLVLWDLRPLKLTGSKVEKIGDLLGITINSAYHIHRKDLMY